MAWREGRADTALRWLTMPLWEAGTTVGSAEWAETRLRIVPMVADLEGPDRARELVDAVIEILEGAGNSAMAAEAMLASGHLALDRKDKKHAAHAFREALTVYERIGDERGAASALMSLGDATEDREALSHYEEALRRYEGANLRSAIGRLYGRLAVAHLRMDEDDTAGIYRNRLLEMAERVKLRDELARYDHRPRSHVPDERVPPAARGR